MAETTAEQQQQERQNQAAQAQREKDERDRLERERLEKERVEKERTDKERAEKDAVEKEKDRSFAEKEKQDQLDQRAKADKQRAEEDARLREQIDEERRIQDASIARQKALEARLANPWQHTQEKLNELQRNTHNTGVVLSGTDVGEIVRARNVRLDHEAELTYSKDREEAKRLKITLDELHQRQDEQAQKKVQQDLARAQHAARTIKTEEDFRNEAAAAERLHGAVPLSEENKARTISGEMQRHAAAERGDQQARAELALRRLHESRQKESTDKELQDRMNQQSRDALAALSKVTEKDDAYSKLASEKLQQAVTAIEAHNAKLAQQAKDYATVLATDQKTLEAAQNNLVAQGYAKNKTELHDACIAAQKDVPTLLVEKAKEREVLAQQQFHQTTPLVKETYTDVLKDMKAEKTKDAEAKKERDAEAARQRAAERAAKAAAKAQKSVETPTVATPTPEPLAASAVKAAGAGL